MLINRIKTAQQLKNEGWDHKYDLDCWMTSSGNFVQVLDDYLVSETDNVVVNHLKYQELIKNVPKSLLESDVYVYSADFLVNELGSTFKRDSRGDVICQDRAIRIASDMAGQQVTSEETYVNFLKYAPEAVYYTIDTPSHLSSDGRCVNHEPVNVGFTSYTLACKHCGVSL